MRTIIALAAVTVLTGCSVADDPDNIPLKGMWEIDYRASSLRAGNIFLGQDDLPDDIKRLANSDRRCVEPKFATKEDFIDDFNSHMKGQCEMTDYETDGKTMRASGACSNMGAMDFKPVLKVKGDVAEDQFKMVMTFDGAASIPGAGRRAVTLITVAEAKRVGDC